MRRAEHLPLLQRDSPPTGAKVEYWHVDDAPGGTGARSKEVAKVGAGLLRVWHSRDQIRSPPTPASLLPTKMAYISHVFKNSPGDRDVHHQERPIEATRAAKWSSCSTARRLHRFADAVKQAHWNVKGPSFIALHELFDKVNEAVEDYVDDIAEQGSCSSAAWPGHRRMAAKAVLVD